MGDRRCCCGCPSWTDDFNRADSTDLGENWYEFGSLWEIKDNTLYHPGGSVGDFVIEQPTIPWSWVVEVDVLDVKHDDVYTVLCDAKADGTDYHHTVVLTFDFSEGKHEATLALQIDGVTQESVTLDGVTSGSDYTISVCYTGGLNGSAGAWHAEVHQATDLCNYVWIVASIETDERHFGLMTSTSNPTYWDNFYFEGLYVLNPLCPECWCSCDDKGIPYELTATIENITNCPRLFGAGTFTLTYRKPWLPVGPGPVDYCYWSVEDGEGGPNCADAVTCSPACYFRVVFKMQPTIGAPDFKLLFYQDSFCFTGACRDCGNPGDVEATLVSSTCDPLVLVFELEWDSWEYCGDPVYSTAVCCDEVPGGPPANPPDTPSAKHRKIRITITE